MSAKKRIYSDLKRVKATRDEDIDFTDAPMLTEAQIQRAKPASEIDFADLTMPRSKQRLAVRFDADVVDFFKSGGSGYQTRMNAVLRMYMETSRKGSTRKMSYKG
jgi:uncharacterized protein (DUF4415 family)